MRLFLASAFLGRAEFQELVSLGITELGKLRGIVVSNFHTILGAGARREVSSYTIDLRILVFFDCLGSNRTRRK